MLHDLSLQINEGEFIAIVGYSGSGKSTLISLIAGLLMPDSGDLEFDGQNITAPSPDRAVVFQNYSLLPWLSAFENIKLAVEESRPDLARSERDQHCLQYLAMVNLSHAKDKLPSQLSGGMRQRVALARALAMQPRLLLLDEPLSALDALTRVNLQDEILQVWEQHRTTVLMITNDVDEAILMADRVIPLMPGPKATLGTPLPVALPRPRHRAACRVSSRFRELRGEIIRTLTSARHSQYSDKVGVAG